MRWGCWRWPHRGWVSAAITKTSDRAIDDRLHRQRRLQSVQLRHDQNGVIRHPTSRRADERTAHRPLWHGRGAFWQPTLECWALPGRPAANPYELWLGRPAFIFDQRRRNCHPRFGLDWPMVPAQRHRTRDGTVLKSRPRRFLRGRHLERPGANPLYEVGWQPPALAGTAITAIAWPRTADSTTGLIVRSRPPAAKTASRRAVKWRQLLHFALLWYILARMCCTPACSPLRNH